MNSTIVLLILILATWRLSSLLVSEMGPGDVLERMRYKVGVRYDAQSERLGLNAFADLFICVWCMSFWVGIVLAIAYAVAPVAVGLVALPLALSAGAIIVEKFTNG